MNEQHRDSTAEHSEAQGNAVADESGFASPLVLGIAGYVIFPILALVTATLGFLLVLNDQLVAGVVFLVVLLQIWVVCGIWAHVVRRRKLA